MAASYSYMCGFELGPDPTASATGNGGVELVNGGASSFGTFAVQTAIAHIDGYAFHAQTAVGHPGNSTGTLEVFAITGFEPANFNSVRFYLYINNAYPSGTTAIYGNNAATGPVIELNADGSLTVLNGSLVLVATSSLKLSLNTWHKISFICDSVNGTISIDVDGVIWIPTTTVSGGVGIGTNATIGGGVFSVTSTVFDLYFDDFLVDGSTGPVNIPGGHQTILKSVADGARGSWTGGGGGTTNLFQAVNHIPSTAGISPGTNTSQIGDTTTTIPDSYTAVCETYTSRGITQVQATMGVCSDGVSSVAVAINGSIQGTSNPSQPSASTFNFGNQGSNAGLWSSGWFANYSLPPTTNPSVNLALGPQVKITKTTSNAINAMAAFLGVYVDYALPGPPPLSKVKSHYFGQGQTISY
jgi:hypothetical protein